METAMMLESMRKAVQATYNSKDSNNRSSSTFSSNILMIDENNEIKSPDEIETQGSEGKSPISSNQNKDIGTSENNDSAKRSEVLKEIMENNDMHNPHTIDEAMKNVYDASKVFEEYSKKLRLDLQAISSMGDAGTIEVAEHRKKDTELEEEMNKKNILQQASVSAIAQANQPQNQILKLLS